MLTLLAMVTLMMLGVIAEALDSLGIEAEGWIGCLAVPVMLVFVVGVAKWTCIVAFWCVAHFNIDTFARWL